MLLLRNKINKKLENLKNKLIYFRTISNSSVSDPDHQYSLHVTGMEGEL